MRNMFWKKKKKDFKRGDNVKIKKGVKHPALKIEIGDWHGRVFEVFKRTVDVELDSLTLKKLNDEFFGHYEDRGEYPHLITVPKKDLEFSEPRDSYEDVEKVQDEMIDKLDSGSAEPNYRKLVRKWVRHFQRSNYYSEMEETDRTNSDFIIETFSDYMYDYERKTPGKWNRSSVREICLNIVPTKITAEKEVFESYGKVLLSFFQFLEKRNYLKTNSLQRTVAEIKNEIVENSQDSSSWGMAKSFMMGAMKSGVNLDNQKEIDKYLRQQQLKALSELEQMEEQEDPTEKNEFERIGRNQRVTVKYKDGRIEKNIKFKKVEQDLIEGNCELI